MNENKLEKEVLALRTSALEPPDPTATDRFEVKIIEGVPLIRDSQSAFIYRLHIPAEVFALVHLMNELVKPTKKKRKRHHRQQLLKEAGIEPQTGDPSL